MDEFEFYKELYHKENERRTSIDSMLAIPIALLTALFSFVLYLGSTYKFNSSCVLDAFFVLIWLVVFFLCLVSLLFLSFSFIRRTHNYSGIAYAAELHEWKSELLKYYSENGTGSNEENRQKAENRFKEHIFESFIKHVDNNMLINDQKSKNLFQGKKFIVYAIILSLILSIPYGINHFNKSRQVVYVNIVK